MTNFWPPNQSVLSFSFRVDKSGMLVTCIRATNTTWYWWAGSSDNGRGMQRRLFGLTRFCYAITTFWIYENNRPTWLTTSENNHCLAVTPIHVGVWILGTGMMLLERSGAYLGLQIDWFQLEHFTTVSNDDDDCQTGTNHLGMHLRKPATNPASR